MPDDVFTTGVSRHVWETRYRHHTGAAVHDRTIEDTWRRTALRVTLFNCFVMAWSRTPWTASSTP